MLQPINVDPRFGAFDVPIMLAVTLAFAALLLGNLGVRRIVAGLMLLAYAAYTVMLVQV
jgi:cation:H+ antiporter